MPIHQIEVSYLSHRRELFIALLCGYPQFALSQAHDAAAFPEQPDADTLHNH